MTPLLIAVFGGFRDNGALQRRPIALPSPWIFSNCKDILISSSFWQQVFNSVTIMMLMTVMVLSLASAAAFVLSRMQFRGREAIFNFITIGLLFPLQFMVRILLPLVKPALAAVAVLTMVSSWNNFFLPLVVLNSDSLWPLPLGVIQFRGEFSKDWARVLALVSLAIVPAVGFYLAAERQIVAGLTTGSIKG